jgi:radical SAM family uncharacterized protein/radical SAM-linked protein
VNIEDLLSLVQKPSRYIGGEFNSIRKEWQRAGFRMVLVFPDLYEIGMSHQGLQILYHILNAQSSSLAERSFVPDQDLERLLREQGESLFSLESRRPLADFDVIGITLPYELCYSNILTVLDLARLPQRAADRNESHPLVVGGGSGSFNPEPVADFFDAVLLGDGEEAILELAATIRTAKDAGLRRSETLMRLSRIPGMYVPSFFRPLYDGAGELTEIRPLVAGYEKVGRRIIAELESAAVPQPPLVSMVKTVHDRLGVESARGCTRGCRFCQAGVIYRPVRERSPAKVLELARDGIAAGGFDEIGLLSLSTGDYGCLPELMGSLMDTLAARKVSLSVPSMRVGTLTPEIMTQIQRVRKSGFTVAPEAGTDRLRLVINKGITEADLLETCAAAFEMGWKLIKFYFMIGLPTETYEDIEAIVPLVRRALAQAGRRGCSITVSVSLFVPKPQTPFQWEPQISMTDAYGRIDLLKRSLPRKGVKLKWHDPQQSFLEGVLARGDRRLAAVIEKAWQAGARLDGWSEHFDLHTWQQAGKDCNIDLERYLQGRDQGQTLPWQHLDTGVDVSFLQAERDRARAGEYTPDCRVHGCQKCGVCDFKEIMPHVYRPTEGAVRHASDRDGESGQQNDRKAPGFLYRIVYSRLGEVRFLSHLELIQVFFRVLTRLEASVMFSQGFNPTPKVSFSPALPVGTESLVEFLDVELKEPLGDPQEFLARFNRQLPAGLEGKSIALYSERSGPESGSMFFGYEISMPRPFTEAEKGNVTLFHGRQSFIISRIRKGRHREYDIRSQVQEFKMVGDAKVQVSLRHESGKASPKPLELLQAVLGISDDEVLRARVVKVSRADVS